MAATAKKVSRKKTATRKGDKPWAGASTKKAVVPKNAARGLNDLPQTTSVKNFNIEDLKKYSDKALIDLVGDVQNEANKINALPIFNQLSEVKKEVATRFEGKQGVDEEKRYEGKRWGVKIGPKAKSRKIKSMTAVVKALGDKVFIKNATVPLGTLDKLLPEDKVSKLVKKAQDGNRKTTIFAK